LELDPLHVYALPDNSPDPIITLLLGLIEVVIPVTLA
jgi:hypothetical protein